MTQSRPAGERPLVSCVAEVPRHCLPSGSQLLPRFLPSAFQDAGRELGPIGEGDAGDFEPSPNAGGDKGRPSRLWCGGKETLTLVVHEPNVQRLVRFLKRWCRMLRTCFAPVVLLLLAVQTFAGGVDVNRCVFESTQPCVARNPIDQLVFDQLTRLHIHPVLCSDAVFVRRAYLDVLGTIPTAKEARDFIGDPDAANKRAHLIDRLLEREEFADYWSMKWGDILRIKAEFPVNLWPNAAQAYHRWVRESLVQNKPYDQYARELLTASGSNFRVGPVNFYRAVQDRTPEGMARAVALTFMGMRADAWPTNRLAGLAAFFSQIGFKPTGEWKEEHVFWDPLRCSNSSLNTAPGRAAVAAIIKVDTAGSGAVAARSGPFPNEAILPDGTSVRISPDSDPREVFADWLISPKNPWFTRSIVNRIWSWLLGRGIIHEPDDIREDNPPSNPALLEYLERQLAANHYDLKSLYRLILNSQTYQLSSLPGAHPSEAEAEAEANFGRYPLRRLDAEVLNDVINKVAGTSDLYTSAIPEPFTYIPIGMPAVGIADGSITSPFLALFGRSARATGMENERNNRPTPAQWLHLLNSTEVQRKLERGTNLQSVIRMGRGKPSQAMEDLYLTILSRFPTREEREAYAEHQRGPQQKREKLADSSARESSGKPGTRGREDWNDLVWALVNSDEFIYRH